MRTSSSHSLLRSVFVVCLASGLAACENEDPPSPIDGGVKDAQVIDAASCSTCDAAALGDASDHDDGGSSVSDASTPEDVCEVICSEETECTTYCDLTEDPTCDEEKEKKAAYASCITGCNAGAAKPGTVCESSALKYASCLGEHACGKRVVCEDELRRYTEQCLLVPGALVCPMLCAELETGCTPYEVFGLRGADCEMKCETSAATLACVEALYDYDDCTPGIGYQCKIAPAKCDAAAKAVQMSCDELAPVKPSDADLKLCTGVSENQCRCGLWLESKDCELRAKRRCLFALANDEDCKNVTRDFDTCLEDIVTCDRDAMRDECGSEWDAFSEKCSR